MSITPNYNPERETQKLNRIEGQMDYNDGILTVREGTYHNIALELKPVYEVVVSGLTIGTVWREKNREVFAVAVHQQNNLHSAPSLELALAWLFGKEGVGVGVVPHA